MCVTMERFYIMWFFTTVGFCALACCLGLLIAEFAVDFCGCCGCCCQRRQAGAAVEEADLQRQELRGSQMGAVPLTRSAEQFEGSATHWESLS